MTASGLKVANTWRSFSPSRISVGKNWNSPLRLDFVQVGALHFRRIVIIQVIDDREAFALPQQALGQMRSDEPGAAGDKNVVHIKSFLSHRLKLGVGGRHHLEMALIVNPKTDLGQFRSEKEAPERSLISIDGDGFGAHEIQGDHSRQRFLGNEGAKSCVPPFA